MYFTNCSIQDIQYLISANLIIKDEKTKLLYLKMKKVDVRTAVALDVVKMIKNDIKDIGYSKRFPVIFTVLTNEKITHPIPPNTVDNRPPQHTVSI